MTMQWSSPPEMTIDPEKNYQVTIETNKGKISLDLFPDYAPKDREQFRVPGQTRVIMTM